jgi:hypothetical protein
MRKRLHFVKESNRETDLYVFTDDEGNEYEVPGDVFEEAQAYMLTPNTFARFRRNGWMLDQLPDDPFVGTPSARTSMAGTAPSKAR